MGVVEETEGMLAAKFAVLLPHLDERQRRLLLGAEARILGHGGIRRVARAAGVAEGTVSRGVSALEAGEQPLGRVRRRGGGRKRLVDRDSGLRSALLALVEPDMRGDPMSPLRWTTKSTRRLAEELTRQGHRVSADTVADVLRAEGFSLQGNVKTLEGSQHPDRDGQFRYINEQVKTYQAGGDPVVSVDAKKKELVGPYHNPGRQWRPKGDPVRVNTHDFLDRDLGKVVPYGVYDLAANTGWVTVGTDHDTAAFAVAAIRRWWYAAGVATYPAAHRLLITADAGGSNGYRTRAWKLELAALASETGLAITVCHFPPGTSKWNSIEHRLFSHITMNWRGRPLNSHEVIVESIAATSTRTGLRVHAELDTGDYPTGVQVSDAQLTTLALSRHDFHGDWNYTLHPASTSRRPVTASTAPSGRWDPTALSHPALTGLPRADLDALVTALAVPHHAQQEHLRQQRRGGHRRRAPGAGRMVTFPLTDRILACLLHQHLGLPQPLLAHLFGVDRSTISRALRQTQQLLDQQQATTQSAPTRVHTLTDLTAYVAAHGITPAEIKPAS
jgi:transposase